MLSEAVKHWAENCLQESILRTSVLTGGNNNFTCLLHCKSQKVILKCFQQGMLANWRREVDFLSLLNKFDVKAVPQLLESNELQLVSLYCCLEGDSVMEVQPGFYSQTAEFINAINHHSLIERAASIQPAKGAMMNAQELLDDVEQRICDLQLFELKEKPDVDCRKFVDGQLTPWLKKASRILADKLDLTQPFMPCLSPSDIGFHNCLISNRLFFLDFEYAGWDSMEKLVTDFFAQPRFTVSLSELPNFINKIDMIRDSQKFCEVIYVMMPLVHLKWALIFLNEFTIKGALRREHANGTPVTFKQKITQLGKAQRRFNIAFKLLET